MGVQAISQGWQTGDVAAANIWAGVNQPHGSPMSSTTWVLIGGAVLVGLLALAVLSPPPR